MALTTTNGAAVLTADEISSLVVQPLIQQSVAFQVSTVIQTGSHSLRVPVVTDDVESGWIAEGAEIPIDQPTLDEIRITRLSLQLSQQ